MNYRVAQGGLFRCCLQTQDEHMAERTTPPVQGETLSCKYEDDPENENLIFDAGAWRWNREKGAVDGPH